MCGVVTENGDGEAGLPRIRSGCHDGGRQQECHFPSSFCQWEDWDKLLTEEQTSAASSRFFISGCENTRGGRETLCCSDALQKFMFADTNAHTRTHARSGELKMLHLSFTARHTLSLLLAFVLSAFLYKATFSFESHWEVDSLHSAAQTCWILISQTHTHKDTHKSLADRNK